MVKGVNKLSFDEKPLQSIDNVVKSYQCDYCSFQTKFFTELEKHIKSEHIVKDSKLIPERLETLLSMKGISIKEHRVIQAGGGGMCGVNCVSIHSTGYELMGQEIRENVNAQIVQNWPIYRDSYEFPYTERIGITNITFKDELEFLNFRREEEDASKL